MAGVDVLGSGTATCSGGVCRVSVLICCLHWRRCALPRRGAAVLRTWYRRAYVNAMTA